MDLIVVSLLPSSGLFQMLMFSAVRDLNSMFFPFNILHITIMVSSCLRLSYSLAYFEKNLYSHAQFIGKQCRGRKGDCPNHCDSHSQTLAFVESPGEIALPNHLIVACREVSGFFEHPASHIHA